MMRALDSRHGESAQSSLAAFDEIIRTIAFAGTEPVLDPIVPLVRDLLEADQSIAYRLDVRDASLGIDFAFGCGVGPQPRFHGLASAFLARSGRQVTAYRVPVPAPKERNTVHLLDTEKARKQFAEAPIVRDLFPLLGLRGQDQIRVLICDGSHLLAWVGAFRLERFGPREAERLEMLVEPLGRRLKLEENLRRLSVKGAALDVAMDALGSPAFILDARGRVVHANQAGRALSREERANVVEKGKGVLSGTRDDPALSLLRVQAAGLPSHSLLVQHPSDSRDERLTAFARCWGLSPRQREVLREILEGKTNKVIGAKLGIQESTVELHVTSLMRKVAVENRSELISAFWSRLR